MIYDLNSIIDDFFMETNQNRPENITKFDWDKHDYRNKPENKANFEALVKETKGAVDKADDSWKTKTVKNYGESETKSPVVKKRRKLKNLKHLKLITNKKLKLLLVKLKKQHNQWHSH
ncbi:coagulase domain-containing protein [Staphylococcus aureus]|nr:coagulase domain-containing protein [Staphylococcus aureus]